MATRTVQRTELNTDKAEHRPQRKQKYIRYNKQMLVCVLEAAELELSIYWACTYGAETMRIRKNKQNSVDSFRNYPKRCAERRTVVISRRH